MKKIIITLFALLTITALSAQSCLPEGITFHTQSQIDDFQVNYPGCAKIAGSVTIEGVNIISLTGLNTVTRIGGSLVIQNNPNLVYLSGLGNLSVIDSNLTLYNNASLLSIEDLVNLDTIREGNIEITANTSLVSLTGLENVTFIKGYFRIWGNAALSSLNGLGNLSYIGNNFEIWNNYALTSLEGLETVDSIGGTLSINQNTALSSLTGLENLNSIGGGLDITQSYSLATLSGLENLTSLGTGLFIWADTSLTSLAGLKNVLPGSINNYLAICFNYALPVCEIKCVCSYLASPNGTIEIYNNASGCNSQQEVEEACAFVGVSVKSFANEFALFPNPAQSELYVLAPSNWIIQKINIYDNLGKLVKSCDGQITQISISTLQKGIYFVELISNEMKVRKKLIVN